MSNSVQKPRLLVTDFHHLGDAVLSFPFLRAAGEQYEVHMACRPPVRDIASLLLPASQIHTWDPPWHEESNAVARKVGWNPSGALVTQWRKMNFSAVVSPWADPRVQLLWARSGIPHRIGFPPMRINHYGGHLPERAVRMHLSRWMQPVLCFLAGGRPMLTKKLYRDPKNPHQLEAWKQIALSLDLRWSDASPWISTMPATEIPPRLTQARAAGKKILLAHTGGRLPTKLWPMEFWVSTLEALRDKLAAWQLFVFTGPEDSPTPEIPGVIKLPSPTGAKELAALLKHADFVLTHDSFPAHLAYAVGTNVLAVFGSGDPAWFAPGGDQSNAVSIDNCKWRPCLDICRMPSQICLEGLRPATVIHAAIAAIQAEAAA